MNNRKKWIIIITIAVLMSLRVNGDVFPFNSTVGLVVRLLYGIGPTAGYNATRNGTTEGLIRHFGYPFEEHEIRTSDGYILNHQRIPHSKNSTNSPKNNPVILLPGLFVDSLIYVLNGEANSPGFILSNAGYDVWLHNNRGTRYSRKHETLKPDTDKQFWNYSFNDMGLYDLPATVDYVLSVTKAQQVYLMGHSMGGAITSIFLAQNSSYNSKIKGAFLLAPAIKLGRTAMFLGHNEYGFTKLLLSLFVDMEVLPATEYLPMFVSHFCNDKSGTVICNEVVQYIGGYNVSNRQDLEFIFERISRALAGTSVKTLRHFMQMIERKDFSHYDYGKEKNLQEYGQENPPEYDLRDITTPVSVYCSNDDMIVVSDDVIEISQTFGNLIGITNINWRGFSHVDFALSEQMKLLIFNQILAEMETLEEHSHISCVRDSIYIMTFLMFTLTIFLLFILFMKHIIFYRNSN